MFPIEVLLDPEYGWIRWEVRRRNFWEERGFMHYGLCGTIGMVVEANLANGDDETADKLLSDWMRANGRRAARVSRYVPGTHFHALNAKFDTYEQAAAHIRLQGMIVETGLHEIKVYHDGD